MSENPPAATPAGWYPDGNDASVVRYWDGTTWTEHTQPAAGYVGSGTPGTAGAEPAAAATATAVAVDPAAPPAKPKRKIPLWAWITLGLVVLLILIIAIGSANAPDPDAGADAPAGQVEEEEPDAPQVEVPDLSGMTVAEARVAAETAGLGFAAPNGVADDDVVETQSLTAGREVNEGTEIFVTVFVAEPGSLENPHPAGYTVSIYQGSPENTLADMTVAIKDPNANAAIAQANQFNDPPQPGYHYVAVEYTLTGTNKTEPANVSMLLYDWSLSQADGTLIAETSSYPVLPDGWNQVYDVPDLYQGQSGAAVVIYQVPDAYTGPLFATAYGQYVTL